MQQHRIANECIVILFSGLYFFGPMDDVGFLTGLGILTPTPSAMRSGARSSR